MTGDIARLAELFARARRPVVFTGAGVSTESGIPDFRSPGGVWDRYDPSELTYQNFVGSVAPAREVEAAERRSRASDLVIVNLAPTPLDARADLVICGKAGEVMAAVLEGVRA